VRRGVRLRSGGCVLALLSVTACAPATGAAAPPAKAPAVAARTGSPAAGANCTRASKVAIVEKGSGGYAFRPGTLTIERGGFLAVTNKSGQVHPLSSEPDAGIVTSVLDPDERQVIQFPEAGTFEVRSADHHAVLHLTVSGESGCGSPEPTLTVTEGYAFSPTHLSLVATQNFAVVNQSAAAQTVTCTPDPGGNGDHSRLDPGETQLLAIDKPGRYTCASRQHPSVKATVTVTGLHR
jgi:plastocyanin